MPAPKAPLNRSILGIPTPTPQMGLPPGQTDKIGMSVQDMNRGGASTQDLNPNQSDKLSRYFTYVTKNDGNTYVLYNGDRRWAKVTLNLETSGDVSIGDSSTLGIPTSGIGVLLQTNTPREFVIGKGSRLFIASTSVNRVSVFIEPFPWLEQITAFVAGLFKSLASGRAS